MEMEDNVAVNSSPAATASLAEKPLLALINNLVSVSNSDCNTMVDNSQLLEILTKEFNMDLSKEESLIVDIYLNVLKKFLKTWPRWDDIDKLIKEKGDDIVVKKLLMEEYTKLKDYLQRTILYAQTQMSSIIASKQRARHRMEGQPTLSADSQLVMEVSCSRDHLNRLFYRKPHPQTLTIFNVTETPVASKISLGAIGFKDVLNWPHVTVTVSLPNFEFVRRNSSNIERTLINRKLQRSELTYAQLSEQLYWRPPIPSRKKLKFRRIVIVSYLVQLIKYIKELEIPSPDRTNQLVDLFNEIKSDLHMVPTCLMTGSEYQYFLSRYPYVRHLSNTEYSTEEVNQPGPSTDKLKECINPNDFDIHLEELLSPAVTFQMPKFAVPFKEDKSGRVFDIGYNCFTDSTSNWLHIECNWCAFKYEGFLTVYHIVQHFNENHACEPDWQCTNCKRSFSMMFLAQNRWLHSCQQTDASLMNE